MSVLDFLVACATVLLCIGVHDEVLRILSRTLRKAHEILVES